MKRRIVLFIVFALLGCAKTSPPKRAVVPRPFRDLTATERLEAAIKKYRAIESQGGWAFIPAGPKLKLGDQGENVLLLKERLKATGDLRSGSEGDLFDEPLAEALKRFQERHGLEPDGTVGKETLVALNVPVEERIRQLEINLEDLRSRTEDFGERYVVVNIPDYRLMAIDHGRALLVMNVVVGQRKDWQTPLLSSAFSHLILNPKWHVPPDIFRKEVLLHIQKDVNYLAQENMVVMGGEGVVDPATIDWSQVKPEEEKYKIVQREGPGNSLGRMKFMFPNRYAVYLHDTPQKRLFSRAMRALSHGCVRVEKPMDLAEFLMDGEPLWTREAIEAAIRTGKTQWVPLPKATPLHIIYRTAWVDDAGAFQFRNDIYGRD